MQAVQIAIIARLMTKYDESRDVFGVSPSY